MLTPFYFDEYNGNYYFVTVYILFYLLIPYLNKLVNSISNKSLKSLLLILTFFVSFYNFINENMGSRILEFIYIYVAVAYLKKNKNNFLEKNCIKIFICSYGLIVLCIITLKLLGNSLNMDFLLNQIIRFYQRDFILLHLMSFSLFYIMLKIKPFYSKKINWISSHTLGIYLISDNLFFRLNGDSLLFNGIFKSYKYFDSNLYIPYCIIEIIIIFAICLFLDYIIDKIISEKNLFKIKFLNKFKEKISNYCIIK